MKIKTYFIEITLLFILLLSSKNLNSQNFWQSVNGPQGGNYRFMITNQSSGTIYLSSYWNTNHGNGLGGNLYKSVDDGLSWIEIDNGLSSLGIQNIAFSATNNDLVISSSPAALSAQCLVYYSPDNGATWQVKSTTTFNGTSPAVGLTYNLGSDTLFAGKKTAGILYSTNQGATWNSMITGLTNLNSTDLEYGFQGRLYTCTDSINGSNGAKVFVKNGSSWTNVSSGLPNTRINDLYYDASTSTMYAGLANISAGTGKIYKSVNGGSWTQILGYTGSQVIKIESLANGDLLVTSLNQGFWKYSAGSWTQLNSNLNSLKISTLAKDQSGNILTTTKAGIWKLDNQTNVWNDFTNGIINSQGRSMAFSQNGDVVVGTDNGMYISPDAGTNWTHTGLTDTPMMSTILYSPDGRMFAGNSDPLASHIYTSTDNGNSWNINETGYNSTRSSDIAYNSSGTLFVGTGWSNPVHSSADGINWSGPNWNTQGFSTSTLSLAIAIDSSDVIYAGTENFGIWRSTDNGISFDSLSLGFNPSNVSDIKISPNQDIIVTQTPFTGNGNGFLYRSVDGGNSWSNNLLGNYGQPNCIYIASSDSIFIGTSTGVYLSIDSAQTWTLINSGLNSGNIVIHTLEIAPDGYLYAGTAGAGIFKSTSKIKSSSSVSIAEKSAFQKQIHFYPNPANNELKFSEFLEEFTISNSLGQETLKGKGISVSTVELSNGIYFLKTSQNSVKFIVQH